MRLPGKKESVASPPEGLDGGEIKGGFRGVSRPQMGSD